MAGFIAVILNPLVVALQRWQIRRRGWAVAIVSVWAVLVFAGLLAAFGYPLAHGMPHFSNRLPSYVQNAQHGQGWMPVAALLSIPVAGALQVIARELWQATASTGDRPGLRDGEPEPTSRDEGSDD